MTKRYIMKKGPGIVVVYDTEHPCYDDKLEVLGDYNFCRVSFGGRYPQHDKQIEIWQLKMCEELVDSLNELNDITKIEIEENSPIIKEKHEINI